MFESAIVLYPGKSNYFLYVTNKSQRPRLHINKKCIQVSEAYLMIAQCHKKLLGVVIIVFYRVWSSL